MEGLQGGGREGGRERGRYRMLCNSNLMLEECKSSVWSHSQPVTAAASTLRTLCLWDQRWWRRGRPGQPCYHCRSTSRRRWCSTSGGEQGAGRGGRPGAPSAPSGSGTGRTSSSSAGLTEAGREGGRETGCWSPGRWSWGRLWWGAPGSGRPPAVSSCWPRRTEPGSHWSCWEEAGTRLGWTSSLCTVHHRVPVKTEDW